MKKDIPISDVDITDLRVGDAVYYKNNVYPSDNSAGVLVKIDVINDEIKIVWFRKNKVEYSKLMSRKFFNITYLVK